MYFTNVYSVPDKLKENDSHLGTFWLNSINGETPVSVHTEDACSSLRTETVRASLWTSWRPRAGKIEPHWQHPTEKRSTNFPFRQLDKYMWSPQKHILRYVRDQKTDWMGFGGLGLGVSSQIKTKVHVIMASLVAQTVKNLPAMQETRVWSLDQEDCPGEGNGYPLYHSCLENGETILATEGEAWRVVAHRVTESQTQLSN